LDSERLVTASEKLVTHLYGGPRYNGTLVFYNDVRSHLTPQSRVLNLGAGPATRSPIRTLKGEVAEIVGADIDPCVLENPELDRACLIENGLLPLEDGYFDLIVSDYVFEHVDDPHQFLSEAARVLKPGGSLMFRTPNARHYVALISAVTPHRVHLKIANHARVMPEDSHDPYPTRYRMNNIARLRAMGREVGLGRLDVRYVEMEPSYLRFNTAAFLIGAAYERVVNSTELLAPLRANLFGRFVKTAA
jgi:SAM-dependent methyltransferase